MALSDFYEVIQTLTLQGVEMKNVFHVMKLSPGFTAVDIARAYNETVPPLAAPFMSDAVTMTSLEVRCLDNPLDFGTFNVGVPGGDTNPLVSRFVAYGVRFNRLRSDMRHGYKRWPGVTELGIQNGAVTAGYITLLNALNDALVATWYSIIPVNPTNICQYVIIKRVFDETTNPGSPFYRLPINDSELVFYRPLTYQTAAAVTSQNSRKT